MVKFSLFGGKKAELNGEVELRDDETELDPYMELVQQFDGANDWQAQFSKVFLCRSQEDNVAIETKLTKAQAETFCFMISQSRSEGKIVGQDCMGIAKHKDWECIVLCDGHDREGHLMSRGVCGLLPHIMLRRIHERFPDEVHNTVEEDLFYDAFDEVEAVVAWTNQKVVEGDYVRIASGDYENCMGYVTGFDVADVPEATGYPIVSFIDDAQSITNADEPTGYVHVAIEDSEILSPRFIGGCTCICIVRNVKNNECRIATSGDSRLVIQIPSEESNEALVKKLMDDPGLQPVYGTKLSDATGAPNLLFMTPQHNVFNSSELHRLKTDYPGCYSIDDAFLVNPDTNFMIQPTRGLGDHDMHGTGYTHVPEISNPFILPTNSLVFAASDGVFDDKVWLESEIVDRMCQLIDQKHELDVISRTMYDETLRRSYASGYVDDISIFCYFTPLPEGSKEKLASNHNSMDLTIPAFTSKSKSMPSNGLPNLIEDMLSLEGTSDSQIVDPLGEGVADTFFAISQPTRMLTEVSQSSAQSIGEAKKKPKKQKRKTMVRGSTNLPDVIESLLEEAAMASVEEEKTSQPKLVKYGTVYNQDIEARQEDKIRKGKAAKTGVVKDHIHTKVKKGNQTFFKKITNSVSTLARGKRKATQNAAESPNELQEVALMPSPEV